MKTAVVLIGMACSAPASALSSSSPRRLFAGLDLGTSGARISIVEQSSSSSSSSSSMQEVFSDSIAWDDGAYDDADAWMGAVRQLLHSAKAAASSSVGMDMMTSITSICVSGTSASCLMVNAAGDMTRPPRMYNYDVMASLPEHGPIAMEWIEKHAPPKHTARANTASFAKLISWIVEKPLQDGERLCHQSDYVTMKLSGSSQVQSDWHNTLKLGYDVRRLEWPEWLTTCLKDVGVSDPHLVLPSKVLSPGAILGTIGADIASEFGLSPDCSLVGGTTDSNAAFFAAVGSKPTMGTAVTSLGSTLAMKLLSQTFVEDASRGVYSHRFPGDGEGWLIGGASNVGCAVLRQEGFSNQELESLSMDIDPEVDLALSYYPLTKKGERFPVADSEKLPMLQPKPENRRDYLHGILQGISDVERVAFRVLGELGASPSRPTLVLTCGGGSANEQWRQMRQRKLANEFNDSSIKVTKAENTEASFGAAILAALEFPMGHH